MLCIDNNPVETGACDNLSPNVTAKAAPETNLASPFSQGYFEEVRRQGR
jgi:hypothetical protein